MRMLLLFVYSLLLAGEAAAQTETWDVFRFTAPAGWQRNTPGGRLEFLQVRGQNFCQIGLLQSGGGTGDARGDFERDWQSVVAKPYGAPRVEAVDGPAVNGWQAKFGAAPVNVAPTGKFTASLMTYTNGRRVAGVQMNNNHDGCMGEIGAFLRSLKLEAAAEVSAAPAPAPVAMAGGSANVTKAVVDGWQAEIFRDYVRLERNGIAVLIFWSVALNDPLRSGHMGLNVWRATVAKSFRVLREEPQPDVPLSYYQPNAVKGELADSSGRRYVGYMTTGLRNGVATPFLVLAADEGAIQRAFPQYEAIWDMVAFNHFPVSPQELAGRWTSSFSSAAETYYVGSGNYAGLMVAAASVDYDFAANGTYTMKSQAVSGKVGNLAVSKDNQTGTWQVNGYTLVLRDASGKTEEYKCGLIALGGGKALRIQHKVYTGSKWDLLRAK
jgi:hypothetical protein